MLYESSPLDALLFDSHGLGNNSNKNPDTNGSRPRPRQAKFVALKHVDELDSLFPHAAAYSFLLWLLLLAVIYGGMMTQSTKEWIYLQPDEQFAAQLAACCLGLSTLLLLTPNLVHQRPQPMSGILLAAIVTQLVAFVTNLLLAYAPNPVVTDPFTHAPVYLVRWCEWIPLAGLMTFLSEAIDLPMASGTETATQQGWKWPILVALSQSVSCACAIFFPFCTSWITWSAWMALALVTYACMFPRCWYKYKVLRNTPPGLTMQSLEHYCRVNFAAQLMLVCTIVWTVLVVFYFVNMFIYCTLDETHWLRQMPFAMMVDTFFDVLAKSVYMKLIVNVHDAVFDQEGRAQRQLGELRRLSGVLWDSSTDVICVSITHQHDYENGESKVTSMLSPSFLSLVGAVLPDSLLSAKSVALFMESKHRVIVHTDMNGGVDDGEVIAAYYVDSSEMPHTSGALNQSILAHLDKDSPEVQCARGIIAVAHHRKVSNVANHALTHDLFNNLIDSHATTSHRNSSNGNILLNHSLRRVDTGDDCKCEVKVSRHADDHALIAVVRDVTERHKRFEAEERAREETIKRQQDAQSVNRFTRHEVKNGLLSGIELCDSMRNAFEVIEKSLRQDHSKLSWEQVETAVLSHAESSRRLIFEMDSMLHEVLDTVLAEAMARDVLHEVYQPRLVQLDVKGVLTSSKYGIGTNEQFPLIVSGNVPYLLLDPHLIKYIHRNAVSNACKYGKADGKVVTTVEYDMWSRRLEMRVINLPRRCHEQLVLMGGAANQVVFQQGYRLAVHADDEDRHLSSGDGAWIMQKCAKVLGGACSISFEPDCTVFIFRCQAEAMDQTNLPLTENFTVPAETWGIAVDDSTIQRRIMRRILAHAGVQESRSIVVGSNPSDVMQLGNVVRKILADDDSCPVLVIVDENLDYTQCDSTHVILSGSLIMKDILSSLTPEMESRVFALVRSANDSTDDVAIYLQRVHAFFPKAPMQCERVREILAPLWADRFSVRQKGEKLTAVAPTFVANEDNSVVKEELLKSLERVKKLLKDKPFSHVPWTQLWSALHALKGDLMVMEGSNDLVLAATLISSMRGEKNAPSEFESKWNLIRMLVTKAVESL